MTFYFTAPYDFPAGDARASWYQFNGTPSVMFGGTYPEVGGFSSGSMYSYYQPTVQGQLAAASPMAMTSGYVILDGVTTVTTDIAVDTAFSGSDIQVHAFVCQDGLHDHPNMVVDMLPSQTFTPRSPGQTAQVMNTFPMDEAWSQPDLAIILVVQDMVTGEILQAVQSVPDYAAAIVMDCEPDGVEAEWTISGPGFDFSSSGDRLLNVFQAGTFTVTWEDIPYWTDPTGPQVATVAEDGTLTFTGQYTDGPFAASTAGPLGDTGAGRAVSMVDIDNDGDLDMHVVNENAADQLLRNDGGAFTDIAVGLIADAGNGQGAAWADVNSDGFLDVYLTRFGSANQLLVGDGAGGFSAVTSFGLDHDGPGGSTTWVDFNGDNILDLYVTNYGANDVLLKSQGEISPNFFLFSAAANPPPSGVNSSAAIWTDGNLDGTLDLFLTNQFSTNFYYENVGNDQGFNDLTNGLGLGDLGKGMGAAFGDYDNDGDFDLYVANEGMADILYSAQGSFQFNKVLGENLGDSGNGRSVVWADLDNDTFLDLYVTRHNQPDLMLMGDGTGTFVKVPVGPAEAETASNACASGDVDGDGAIDLLVSRDGAANVLFRNEITADNHWVVLKLAGVAPNTSAIGARVVLTADGVSQSRLVTAGSAYLGNSSLDVHFGLGASRSADQVVIHWPSGAVETIGPLVADRIWQVGEGQALSEVPGSVPAAVTSLGLAHPNPFNPKTTISFSLERAGAAKIEVFAIDGSLVSTLADRTFSAGPQQVTWSGTDRSGRKVASGTYYYRLTTANGFSRSGSMVLIK